MAYIFGGKRPAIPFHLLPMLEMSGLYWHINPSYTFLRWTNTSVLYGFYVYGSVHRWSIVIIVQRDATQNSLFIVLQVHSICFVCQPHPSSGVHKTVNIASGTVQPSSSNVVKLAWPRWREVAAQKIWPGVHKPVTTASSSVQLPP